MKRILSEDNPPLLYADETAYVDRLFTHDQDLETRSSCSKSDGGSGLGCLRKLPDAAFERTGQHNRSGTVTVGKMVATYIKHIDDHLKFILGKREKLPK